MSREQVKLTYQIGLTSKDWRNQIGQLETIIAEHASILCGGCTTSFDGAGWWKEDGATPGMQEFTGKLIKERVLQIEVTCELAKADHVALVMQETITAAIIYLELPVDWVHVTETAMTGRHFSVKEMYS